jgi:5-methylcytosine-specific restriction endonuclease McrA
MREAEPGKLNRSVLVLNRFFLAVHIVTARRAFGLLYRETAEVIHIENGQYANYDFPTWCEWSHLRRQEKHEHDDWIRAVRFEVQIPRVIRLTRFDRLPRQTLRFNRRNLFARDGHQCQYCGRRLPTNQLSIDHVLPRSRGGMTTWENVVCSCVRCNTMKGGRTPQEARMQLIRAPVRPRQHPLLSLKLDHPRYAAWRTFLPNGRDDSETLLAGARAGMSSD